MTLSAADFAFVASLVRRESAIVLGPGKEYLVEARLIPVARQAGAASVSEFLARIQRNPDPEAQRKIVDALTTNETSWFRDQDPFTALTQHVLPELIQARAASRHIRLWSAACSSGQEPYSLALLLREHFPDACAARAVRIVATDLSPSMLEKARAGRYSQLEVGRGVPAPMLARWFSRRGVHWELHPEVRAMVEFRAVNLADRATWASVPPVLDLVLLRNVLIYFDSPTKKEVLEGVRARLRPDGVLLLGASETTLGLTGSFARVQSGQTTYYRPR